MANITRFQPGQIVRIRAGRNVGRFYLVIACTDLDLLLADGETRLLAKPKRKNPIHVQPTNQIVAPEGLTDAALRRLLQPMNAGCKVTKSRNNDNRKEVIEHV